jgi:hypothetical protein
MNTVVAIFFNGPITTKGAKYTYFIKYKIIVFIFKFIINIGNYKAEAMSPKINNITINNIIFETALP